MLQESKETNVQLWQKLSMTRNDLNLKELHYYQFHMQTAMKTLDIAVSANELIVNELYSARGN